MDGNSVRRDSRGTVLFPLSNSQPPLATNQAAQEVHIYATNSIFRVGALADMHVLRVCVDSPSLSSRFFCGCSSFQMPGAAVNTCVEVLKYTITLDVCWLYLAPKFFFSAPYNIVSSVNDPTIVSSMYIAVMCPATMAK
jgi:hypothetical protein